MWFVWGHGARGIASQWTWSNTVETGGTGRESSGSPWTPMRSCQNKKGRWVQGCKASSQVGRKDRLGSGSVGRNDPLSRSGREEVGEWWQRKQGEWENKERGSQEPSGPEWPTGFRLRWNKEPKYKKGGGQKQGRERRWPKTEWAGMTDWV